MDAAPFFSVVTVTFRNLDGLERTAQSVRAQDCADLEWLVIDGGSTDGTVEYLAAQSDPRLRFVSERDEGIYHAMQKGLDRATGAYVIFMNAGDLFADAGVLGAVKAAIGTAHPTIVYGDAYESDGTTRFLKPARRPAENAYVMFTHHQSIFYRADALREVGFDRSYRMICDWVMTARMLGRPDSDPLRVPFAVSEFERGGVSQGDSMRAVFDRELFRFYRQEQRHSLPRAAAWWLKKVGVNKARKLMPGLYDRLRYARPAG